MMEAINMYANFPRSKRHKLYSALMVHPDFPFHDDPDESYTGRWFVIATGNYTAPASQDGLDIVVDFLCESMNYDNVQKNNIYNIYIQLMNMIIHKETFINTLNDISSAREGLEARKVWDLYVNLPFKSGPGMAYAKSWPKTINPDRTYSRIKTRPISYKKLKKQK